MMDFIDEVSKQVNKQLEEKELKRKRRMVIWGDFSRILILAYVVLGGGYEIFVGLRDQHVQASFIFSFMSSLIFAGRIMYGAYARATATIWADIFGAIVMLVLSILHVVINGTFL